MNEEEITKLIAIKDAWKEMARLQREMVLCYRTTNHRRMAILIPQIKGVGETLRDLGEEYEDIKE